MPLWEELATLVTIMLLGHWIEMRSISQAQGALRALAKLLPDTAIRVVGDRTEGKSRSTNCTTATFGPAAPGREDSRGRDRSRGLEPGERVDDHRESRPVPKSRGDKVIAGTVNAAGSLRVEVTGIGERTVVAGIMRLVEQAQQSRSRRSSRRSRCVHS